MANPDWKELASSIKIDGRAFIGGRRVAAHSGALFDCISPIDGRKIADVARGTGFRNHRLNYLDFRMQRRVAVGLGLAEGL